MISLTLQIYHQSNYAELKSVWEVLERGSEMTYFQTYRWNTMLLSGVPNDSAWSETCFVVAYREQQPIMIAPLWIIKKTYRIVHKPAVFVLGTGGWSDYLNFIYDSFYPEAVKAILEYVKKSYGYLPMTFSSLKGSSSLARYLQTSQLVLSDVMGQCVTLDLPQTYEAWWQSLSKHTKQNIRTAKNRLEKDGIDYTLCFDNQEIDKHYCIAVRNARSQKKLTRDEGKVSLPKCVKRWIKSKFCSIPCKGYMPILDDEGAMVMTICNQQELMAYFHYSIDPVHRQVVVLSAGVVDKYTKYSPGIILMTAFIDILISNQDIISVDFTRGDEPYKLALGGNRMENHTITIQL